MFPSTLLIETICLLAAARFLQMDASPYWKSFIWFMLFIVLIDGAGWVMATFYRINNHWLYNIQLPVEAVYVGFIIHMSFEKYIHSKPLLILGLVIFFIAYGAEIFYNTFRMYAAFSSSLVSIFFFISGGLYFFILLKQDEQIDLFKNAPFWIMAGIFFFYFSSIAVNLFSQELMNINIAGGIPLRYYIFTILNALLYGCWIKAFRCRYLEMK